jgi:hypothetical protein
MADQEERAQSYKVRPKQGGYLKKPPDYESLEEDDFLDPVNYRYPVDEKHLEATLASFNQPDARYKGGYSRSEWSRLGRRLADVATKSFGRPQVFKEGRIVAAPNYTALEQGKFERWSHEEKLALADLMKSVQPEILKAIAEPLKGLVAQAMQPLEQRLHKVEQMAAPAKAVLRAIDKGFSMQPFDKLRANGFDEGEMAAQKQLLNNLIADAKDEGTRQFLSLELYKLDRRMQGVG